MFLFSIHIKYKLYCVIKKLISIKAKCIPVAVVMIMISHDIGQFMCLWVFHISVFDIFQMNKCLFPLEKNLVMYLHRTCRRDDTEKVKERSICRGEDSCQLFCRVVESVKGHVHVIILTYTSYFK